MPLITPTLEADLYHVLLEQTHRLECQSLALGGLADHVHLVLRVPGKHAPADVAKMLKGTSSTWARQVIRPHRPLSAEPFGWQDNYACFSLSCSHLSRAVAYVQNQNLRHAENTLWPEWEETHEELS